MIPSIIHQIWLGPKQMPIEWMQTWCEKNPHMTYEVWTESRILDFGLKNKKQYDYYMSFGLYHGASDVARIEILERYGGVYMDADLSCIYSIEDADFMKKDLFAVHECDGRVANGIIGAKKHHPILQEYITQLGALRVGHMHHPWRDTGGTVFTRCIEKYSDDTQIQILPACAFLPTSKKGNTSTRLSKIYATHTWGTTNNLYN